MWPGATDGRKFSYSLALTWLMATIIPIPNLLEARALELTAAWADFNVVEQSAKEVIRRFQAVQAAEDIATAQLRKDPLFVALQIACVFGYTRPFANGLERIAAGYGKYRKGEWQQLHEALFAWRTYLTGSSVEREFIVAHAWEGEGSPERLVVIEAGAGLEPSKDFAALRDMCADRKAMLVPAIKDAVAQCSPMVDQPILLSPTGVGSA